jgi:HD-GYP domain-containing protein (c-di-GMP phosphodiesterase class II)
MDFQVKSKISGSSGTFTGTINAIIKFVTIAFILLNYAFAAFAYAQNPAGVGIVPLTAVSIFQILLMTFVEPGTRERFPAVNFAVNILMAVGCGVLFFSYKTYLSMAVFFTTIVIAGLRLSMLKSVILSAVYYLSYLAAMMYGSQTVVGSVLFDGHIFIMFLLIVYLAHHFSMIENQKASQDETIMEILEEKVDLTQGLECKNAELERSYWDMVETLIGVIEARDQFTGGHSVKVCEYSVRLAKSLGYSDDEVSDIMKASILHDIGKMGIPDNILLKPGTLSNDEYDVIMNHPEIGCRILSKVRGLENILPMILYHHERVDGTGYPYGLAGDRIPVGARIIAIADAYDAMTSNRPYRKALLKKEARKRIIDGKGTQFDSELADVFIEMLDSDNVEDIRNYRYIENIKKHAGIM